MFLQGHLRHIRRLLLFNSYTTIHFHSLQRRTLFGIFLTMSSFINSTTSHKAVIASQTCNDNNGSRHLNTEGMAEVMFL